MMDHQNKIYTGKISRMPKGSTVRKAWDCFYAQKQRCGNPKNSHYKHYGDKSISVEYDIRSFVYWFLTNYPDNMRRPSVGRIDHSDNYKIENIKFEELSDNVKERNARAGQKAQKLEEWEVIFIKYFSLDASETLLASIFNVSRTTIGKIRRNERWSNI